MSRAPIVWSIAYVWPRGRGWARAAAYARCVVEFIRRRARPTTHFLLSVHPAVPPRLVRAFEACAPNVHVRACALADDPFYPTMQRLFAAFDAAELTRGATVVVADVHDHFGTQDGLLRRLRREMGSAHRPLGLTAWPGESPCVAGAALPLVSGRPHDLHWHIDAGMLVSEPAFRERLARAGASLERFVRGRPFRRSEEEFALESFCAQPSVLPIVRRESCVLPHRSYTRECDCAALGPERLWSELPPPAYAPSGRRAEFAHCGEYRGPVPRGRVHWSD